MVSTASTVTTTTSGATSSSMNCLRDNGIAGIDREIRGAGLDDGHQRHHHVDAPPRGQPDERARPYTVIGQQCGQVVRTAVQRSVVQVLAGTPHRDATGSALPAGLQQLRHGARPVGRRLSATTPLGQDPVLLLGVRQHHVAQTLVDVLGELGDDPSQPAGQPFDGVPLVELGAVDEVPVIPGPVGASVPKKFSEVGVRHVECGFQRGERVSWPPSAPSR